MRSYCLHHPVRGRVRRDVRVEVDDFEGAVAESLREPDAAPDGRVIQSLVSSALVQQDEARCRPVLPPAPPRRYRNRRSRRSFNKRCTSSAVVLDVKTATVRTCVFQAIVDAHFSRS